ncbi:MAG TPA: hypothetical protein VGL69_11810 [Solirubrobacteraceae bacterium]|jgi:hypothetical protein
MNGEQLANVVGSRVVQPNPQSVHRRQITLGAAVSALDALERPFAACDRERLGPLDNMD